MRIPIAIRGGFDKKKLPSRSESSENIQLNKLEFVNMLYFNLLVQECFSLIIIR